MFNLEALDKLIAVVVTLLVLSLIVQSIQSAIKNFFRIKSLQLEHSLIHLFYYILNKDAIKAMRSVADRAPLLRAFFGAPIIRKIVSRHLRSDQYRAISRKHRKDNPAWARWKVSGRRNTEVKLVVRTRVTRSSA